MNNDIPSTLTPELHRLYKDEPVAKKFFNWLAARHNGSFEMKVRVAAYRTGESAEDIRWLFQELAEMDLGMFIVGRKGHESRIQWHFDVRSLGKVAKGEIDKPEPNMSTPADDKDENEDDQLIQEEGLFEHNFRLRNDLELKVILPDDFTSAEAKRLSLWIQSLPFDL